MVIHLDRSGTIDGLRAAIETVAGTAGVHGLFILGADANGFTPRNLDPVLQAVPLPLFGGIFSSILHDQEVLETGTLVAGLRSEPRVSVVSGLSGNLPDFDDVLDDALADVGDFRTMIVLVDGTATRVNTLLASLFNVFGLACSYCGGGAGSLSLDRRPCLLTGAGLIQDAALAVTLPAACGVGVKHGMRSVSGPHKITEAVGNTIVSLDWQPAYALFKGVIESQEAGRHQAPEVFPVDRHYAVAVNRLDAEKVVREPTRVGENDSLRFTCEMVEGEFVDVVRASQDSTIEAARQALLMADEAYDGEEPPQTILCFTCSARRKFLGPAFVEEVRAARRADRPLIGACTIGGEIANSGRDYLDYLNRTCVVGAFEE